MDRTLAPTAEPARLTLPETAKYLRVSTSTIYKLTAAHAIPFIKMHDGRNGRVIFERAKLDEWLDSRAVPVVTP